MSDEETEFQIYDRLSFQQFLDFPNYIPDYSTIWRFREELAEGNLFDKIWEELQSQIDNIIEKFDGYEYYLYFTSASTAWPKTSTTQPYPLYSATSSQVTSWLGSAYTTPSNATMSMYFSSSRYDNGNKDWLQYTTPGYIRDDQNNGPY